MKELEQSGAALESDIVKDNLKDIIAELSQPILDTFGKAIGENIPGLSWFFKGMKAYKAVRDQDLMNKVIAFLYEADKMDQRTRKKLVDKVNDDPIYGQKFGAFVLVALDRYDFAQKVQFLVNALKFYERGDISKHTLIRFNAAIKDLHLMDLEQWINDHELPSSNISEVGKQMFMSHGLIQTTFNFQPLTKDHTKDDYGRNYRTQNIMKTKLSDFGNLFFHVLKDMEITDFDRQRRIFEKY